MKNKETFEKIINYLNELLEVDATAVESLVSNRVPCNEAMANHPTVSVSGRGEDYSVGLLGFLNGLCRDIEGETFFGPIVAVYEDETDVLKRFRLATDEEIKKFRKLQE